MCRVLVQGHLCRDACAELLVRAMSAELSAQAQNNMQRAIAQATCAEHVCRATCAEHSCADNFADVRLATSAERLRRATCGRALVRSQRAILLNHPFANKRFPRLQSWTAVAAVACDVAWLSVSSDASQKATQSETATSKHNRTNLPSASRRSGRSIR